MSTIKRGAVYYTANPQDHDPIHIHCETNETVAIIELLKNGEVRLANRKDRVYPANAHRNKVNQILNTAVKYYDDIVDAWKKMQVGAPQGTRVKQVSRKQKIAQRMAGQLAQHKTRAKKKK